MLVPVAHAAPLGDPRDRGIRSSQLICRDAERMDGGKGFRRTYHDSVKTIKKVSRVTKSDCH